MSPYPTNASHVFRSGGSEQPIRFSSAAKSPADSGEDATMLMVLNGWHDVVKFTLPMHPGGRRWSLLIDTNAPELEGGASQFAFGSEYAVTARSLLLFALEAER